MNKKNTTHWLAYLLFDTVFNLFHSNSFGRDLPMSFMTYKFMLYCLVIQNIIICLIGVIYLYFCLIMDEKNILLSPLQNNKQGLQTKFFVSSPNNKTYYVVQILYFL